MSPDEHAARAQELVAEANEMTADRSRQDEVANVLRMAQVHATLSLRQPAARLQPPARPASGRTAAQRTETGRVFPDVPTVASGDPAPHTQPGFVPGNYVDPGDPPTGFPVGPEPTGMDVGSSSVLDHTPQPYDPDGVDGEER